MEQPGHEHCFGGYKGFHLVNQYWFERLPQPLFMKSPIMEIGLLTAFKMDRMLYNVFYQICLPLAVWRNVKMIWEIYVRVDIFSVKVKFCSKTYLLYISLK